jgi:ABC-type long-subunit fatty acid transport system fused permease/ATPase subunit
MDEEYIRNAFAPISNVSANADALQAWKKTHRSMKRRAALYADFLRRTFPVTVGGIKLPGLKFSQARTEKVMRKIVLGLHYHHTGMIRASQ